MIDHGARPHVLVIGGGFTGLAAAYELSRRQLGVTILEKEEHLGGLAGSFEVNGAPLEKFYHHWFNNDTEVLALVRELQADRLLRPRLTKTGIWVNQQIYPLSTPLDLLRFSPLSWLNRARLGLLVLQARRITDWRKLESMTARDWLVKLCGRQVYQTVWEPLLRGKFGEYASEISAAWFWKKLVLRGGSRTKGGKEELLYFHGGFAALAEIIGEKITAAGGQILTNVNVEKVIVNEGRIAGVATTQGDFSADAVIATPALPIIETLIESQVPRQYTENLKKIKYLANVCLVLELDHSLSEYYWLNVTDPEFPFVGIIEHTNFEPPETYGGRHIVYLSKYLPETSALFKLGDRQLYEFSLPHLKRLFPAFEPDWIKKYHVWRARFAQPVVDCPYPYHIPSPQTPLDGCYIATMAQIYPEDRGTNYAVREGRRVGTMVSEHLSN